MSFITRTNAAGQAGSLTGPSAGDPDFMRELGCDLRTAFRAVLHEDLPETLAKLVRQLEDREQAA